MKHKKIIDAYIVLNKLCDKQFDLKTSFKLLKLKNQLKEYYDFQMSEEQKLFDQYNPEYKNGNYIFKNTNDADLFKKRIEQINNMDHDIDINKIQICIDTDLNISAKELEEIECFIDITE